jgi:hypothetical protein
MTDGTEVESEKEKISNLEAHDVKCGSWATLRLFHARTCHAMPAPDGKDTAATRMYGRGGTANGSPSRLMLRLVRVRLGGKGIEFWRIRSERSLAPLFEGT